MSKTRGILKPENVKYIITMLSVAALFEIMFSIITLRAVSRLIFT